VTATVGFALMLRPAVMAAGQLSLVAIVITGWVCGLRPALLAWGLATLAFAYFFTPPLDSLCIDLVEAPRLTIFALLGLFMATVSAARRRAEDSLEKAREGLEARVRERTARPDAGRTGLDAQRAGARFRRRSGDRGDTDPGAPAGPRRV
jgi:K+-sensing histidine kinase KdpD